MIDTDRFKSALATILRELLPNLPFLGVWRYTVTSSTATTCSAQPQRSAFLPTLDRVPMLSSVTGGKGTLKSGATVLVMFVNGDPGDAVVVGLDPSKAPSLVELDADIVKINGGTMGAARMGDAVVAGPFGGTITSASATTKIG